MPEIKLGALAEEDVACFANHLGATDEWGELAIKPMTDAAQKVGGAAAHDVLDLVGGMVVAREI